MILDDTTQWVSIGLALIVGFILLWWDSRGDPPFKRRRNKAFRSIDRFYI